MKADAFVENLRSAMPSLKALEDYGLDEDEIDEIQSTFRATPKAVSKAPPSFAGELGRLVGSYDCTGLEIGLVSFEGELKEHANGLIFGHCEADTLVVRNDGAVAMYEHDAPSQTAFLCAVDSEHFLDALATFVSIRTEKGIWKGRVGEAAQRCCSASGEPASVGFYELLCGFLA
jgi:hypothetical protein